MMAIQAKITLKVNQMMNITIETISKQPIMLLLIFLLTTAERCKHDTVDCNMSEDGKKIHCTISGADDEDNLVGVDTKSLAEGWRDLTPNAESGSYTGYGGQTRGFNFYYPTKPMQDEDGKILPQPSGGKPLIICLHPGAFIVGNRNCAYMKQLCEDFSGIGYATVTIDYSSYKGLRSIFTSPKTMIGSAICDVNEAIKHFQNNATHYGINPNKIFLAGYSAGGILALNIAFLDTEQFANTFGITGYQYVKPQVAGIVSISGGLLAGPMHAENSPIDASDTTPLLMFHGNKDEMVPYGIDKPMQVFKKSVNIEIPGIRRALLMTNGDTDNEDMEVLTKIIRIPEWLPKLFINGLAPRIMGSQRIHHDCAVSQLITVDGGDHNFVTDKDGSFNDFYIQMREKMRAFFCTHAPLPNCEIER
jgi:acetyl esterase/lipase